MYFVEYQNVHVCGTFRFPSRARASTLRRASTSSRRARGVQRCERSLLMRSHARASTSARSHARARDAHLAHLQLHPARKRARARARSRGTTAVTTRRARSILTASRENTRQRTMTRRYRRAWRRRVRALGDSGTDVALTQRLLGLDSHGVCDAATSEEIKRFQRSRDGLHPSGFFGASSRAQVAREEEAWRARGGGELLRACAREARRAEGETLVSVDWRARARAPVWSGWSARAIQGAVWVAATGVVVGAPAPPPRRKK